MKGKGPFSHVSMQSQNWVKIIFFVPLKQVTSSFPQNNLSSNDRSPFDTFMIHLFCPAAVTLYSCIAKALFRRLIKRRTLFLKNGPDPASFSFIFGLFKQTVQFLQQINAKKCPSSIQCWDLNPQPLEHELSPITTRPGLSYQNVFLCIGWKDENKKAWALLGLAVKLLAPCNN